MLALLLLSLLLSKQSSMLLTCSFFFFGLMSIFRSRGMSKKSHSSACPSSRCPPTNVCLEPTSSSPWYSFNTAGALQEDTRNTQDDTRRQQEQHNSKKTTQKAIVISCRIINHEKLYSHLPKKKSLTLCAQGAVENSLTSTKFYSSSLQNSINKKFPHVLSVVAQGASDVCVDETRV